MLRDIITIDQDKCIGCGLCVRACQEGAIGMVDGKARLLRDDYCDGLGNCLPTCPVSAISFETREAAAFDSAAVQQHKARLADDQASPAGCPGRQAMRFEPAPVQTQAQEAPAASQLGNFPVQLQLVAVNAPFLDNAKLLISADCAAYASGDFHRRIMTGHVTLIGCPKLDAHDQAAKLTEILKHNNIKSVKVVRMEVPCCGGLVRAATQALKDCGKMIPWQVVTLSVKGDIIED
ncbi:MAG: 4Fe-4S binding protein [Clostridiales bacterium]|nr:4Fe-4S binding protein [Clostridiales bacterium]